ncbi:MAG: hypothetical protein J6I79_05515 [Paludibacteraceae bacterium]|nr:hypothetical protein [Paludibacteraceae bacterium]
MKKIFLFVTSLVAVASFAFLPMACSNDDEESENEPTPAQDVQAYSGTLMYGQLTKDSVFAKITKKDGNISLSISTGIPYLSYDFSDVNIKVSGDTSYLRAQNETIDTGSDAQLTLAMDGKMYDNCNQLYLVITGTELTDTLFFATDKAMLGLGNFSAPDLFPNEPTEAYKELLNGVWEGEATYDGQESGFITFTSSITDNGFVDIDLGKCKFSEKMPEMNIVLDAMYFFSNLDTENMNFDLKGFSASYTLGKISDKLGANINGNYENGSLTLDLSLSVMNKDHTIAIKNAKRK